MSSYLSQADMAPVIVQVAAVLEIAAPVNLDVLPGKLLPNPAKTGLRHQFKAARAFLRLDFLLKKDVDAVGRDLGVGDRCGRPRVGLQPRQVARQFDHAAQLRQRPFFTGQGIKLPPGEALSSQVQRQRGEQEDAEQAGASRPAPAHASITGTRSKRVTSTRPMSDRRNSGMTASASRASCMKPFSIRQPHSRMAASICADCCATTSAR